MITQTIPPESLTRGDLYRIFARSPSADDPQPRAHEVDAGDVAWAFHLPEPGVTAHPRTPETPAGTEQSLDNYDSEEISEIVCRIGVSVLVTDSDVRLDYLQSVNPNLTGDHLDQIATTTERWLDDKARDRIRAIARRCHDNKSDPQNMLVEWNTPEEAQRLIDLLLETSIPDKTLAMFYSMCAAYDTAHAALFIHRDRAHRQTDFASIEQTPEEIAGDLRFVNAQ